MNKETLFQLCEICEEILTEIRNHLNYMSISVYKGESISLINEQIDQLRVLMESIPNSGALEPFHDFDAEKLNHEPVPGECSYSMRVQRLLVNVDGVLKTLRTSYKEPANIEANYNFEKVKKYKSTLQSSCPVGSKRWKFLQSI
ncbi:MAG: hypothetical protein HRU09_16065 [Oligoflexales bacterium]|nr:hypothetical protein [Oligoflexales bacterium]